MLRTLGTNTVLGLSGAPVCAQHLRLSPLAIGASNLLATKPYGQANPPGVVPDGPAGEAAGGPLSQ